MKIAIHHRNNSFSQRWIEYCKENDIAFMLVNCFDSNIMSQLKDCDVLMWHWSHEDPKAKLFAKQLMFSLEKASKRVFPNSNTVWHFDDKVAQKYLLEAIEAPLVNSYVFYSKEESFNWIEKATFPKVFKLRGGAGSINVKLVKNKGTAKKLVRKSFDKGFGASGRKELMRNRLWHFRKDKNINTFLGILKGLGRLFLKTDLEKMSGREKGYAYFQDFIPNNNSDTRVIVIGNKAFAIERIIRKNDFRASGSGIIKYPDNDSMDKRCIEIAFEISKKLQSQCTAYDFVYKDNTPLIIEISYGFTEKVYYPCKGYWDDELNWHKGSFNPQYFMIEDILNT
ncbi:hypothetical protein KIM67_02515 [Flagellimonas sp. 389]|uniref:ATP-grasp domain-containing protein n=1 Tax=Flagellimonas sp. 389 TaxID=2835862 RepID=UPI001BD5D439|nr:hypothetical protein [Flagellimonas sp. 389]MBS9461269.1 hypothetical protein [Flagellimonas sp. 389]